MAINRTSSVALLSAFVLSGCATDDWVARQYGDTRTVESAPSGTAPVAPQPQRAEYPAPANDQAGASYDTQSTYSVPPQQPARMRSDPTPAAPRQTPNGLPAGYVPSVGAQGYAPEASAAPPPPASPPTATQSSTRRPEGSQFIIESE